MSEPQEDTSSPRDTSAVGLRWAVKRSFLEYVARTPDGRAYVAGGVTANAASEVIFPPAGEYSEDHAQTGQRVYGFRGEVRYIAHGGLLHVAITDPVVTVVGDAGNVTITTTDDDGQPARVELVTFTVGAREPGAPDTTWEATDVRLSADGVAVFGDVYSAGELMAPLHIQIPPPR
ncbi:HtaA domain-containing protein [Mycobacterium sp. 48b]|uniref:HtaA domain-containing protein n=1 Tax=Mycobacterium sp. 48b TaxID=3400426 RepID=UPI003AAF8A24